MTRFTAALVLTGLATAAAAEPITLTAPQAGATLNGERVDMSVFWTEADTGYEVTAVYLPKHEADAPRRISMVLAEGDNVRFGLPGLPGTIYSFARQNDAVTVEATPTWINLAQN